LSFVTFDESFYQPAMCFKALLEKLKDIGLNRLLLKWITDYLTNRKQQVVVNGETSEELPVLSGVPRGQCLDHYCS